MEEELTEITGTVENILFKNESNGYIVFDINSDNELITVVGELGDIDENEKLRLRGSYKNHYKFGNQFCAEYVEFILPSVSSEILEYLSGGIIKGINKSLAKKIVKEFGEKTLNIIENDPEKLTIIKGIPIGKAMDISKEFNKIVHIKRLTGNLGELGIKPKYTLRIFKKWQYDSIKMLKDNPYRLCDRDIGISFLKAEQIAKNVGIASDSPKRISAGIRYVLEVNAENGHTCLPLEQLEKLSCNYLEIGGKDFYNSYNSEIEQENIFEYEKNNRTFIYLEEYYHAEKYIADRLAALKSISRRAAHDYSRLIDIEEQTSGISYHEIQRQAISEALSKGIMILTGGPGTGKTTTLNAIISIYENKGDRVMITAPTGRAAKRISELTGHDARTIHRMLEVEFDSAGNMKFVHNEKNPLECDVMVIDEMSMIDVQLFSDLLKALRVTCRIVMVGDSDQLPSVKAGNVLKDLIESSRLPVVCLKEIFRQSEQSCIITNAHKIINGIYPDIKQKNNDFFFFQRMDSESASELVISLYAERLPKAYNYSIFDDIQILSPSRKGFLGTVELNKKIQQTVNPKQYNVKEVHSLLYTFREGDKVMQIKNNYDIQWTKDDDEKGAGIYNGDIGKILSINTRSREAKILFDDKLASYNIDQLDQLELAYAVTIHKSQGSEFPAVIIPVLEGFDKLYYRNLLYTGVTRARKLLIIVGSQLEVYRMVDNNRRTLRYTCLKDMIENEIDF